MGVEQTPNKSQHTKSTLEKAILPPLLLTSQSFDHKFGALTNKLSQLQDILRKIDHDHPLLIQDILHEIDVDQKEIVFMCVLGHVGI